MATKKNLSVNDSGTREPSSPTALASNSSSSCCKGTSSCSAPATTSSAKSSPQTLFPSTAAATKKIKTQIIVKYDVGFNNHLFLRGNGANLNWEKGAPLKNVKRDEWIWETDTPFSACEFKVLINDKHYEAGENQKITCGAVLHHTPKF